MSAIKVLTRTVYSILLQSNLLLGRQPTIPTNTTLNQKWSILAGASLAPNERPKAGYLAIGNRGHRFATGPDGIPYSAPTNHRARDAACFNHIPFIMRPLTQDISGATRNRYGLRRVLNIGGQNYAAYYLRRLDTTLAVPEMYYTTVNNGVETTNPFTATVQDLSPTPPEVNPGEIVSTSGDYLSVSAPINIVFTPEDVQELLNVANILYDGNSLMAIISEFAVCSGVDVPGTTGPGPSGTEITYLETKAVQVNTFVANYIQVALSTASGFDLTVDVGGVEPLFGTVDMPVVP